MGVHCEISVNDGKCKEENLGAAVAEDSDDLNHPVDKSSAVAFRDFVGLQGFCDLNSRYFCLSIFRI